MQEAKAECRSLKRPTLSIGPIQNLVNLWSHGEHILCTMRKEKGINFDLKVIQAGAEA